jgi:hypothetical protein
MDLTNLAEDRDRWRAVVNAVMEFGCHKMQIIFLLDEFFKKDCYREIE